MKAGKKPRPRLAAFPERLTQAWEVIELANWRHA